MTKLIAMGLLITLSTFSAYAGSSSTRLACSSASGKTVIAGILPGQGENTVNLQYSIESFFRQFDNEDVLAENVTVELNVNQAQVRIGVLTNGDTAFSIDSKNSQTTKLKRTANGVSGEFIGQLYGTDIRTGQMLQTPIELRCFVSNEI